MRTVKLVTNPALTPQLQAELIALWVTVANDGGAVGFVAPTSEDEVTPVANAAFARVTSGKDDIVVAYDGERAVGFAILETNDVAPTSHWATVRRPQRAPLHAGQGIGAHLPERLLIGDDQTVEELRMSRALRPPDGGARLAVRRLDAGLPLPSYARPGDAGLDLYARESVTLKPGARALVPTGVAIALPDGHVGLVHPRSGLAARHGVTLVNAPGTIDAGYRGEIKVILANTDLHEPVILERGSRIAQLLVQRVEHVQVVEVDTLPTSVRGAGGFGSTGA